MGGFFRQAGGIKGADEACRMSRRVHFLEFADRHVRVDGGRLQIAVAQDRLDVTDVSPVLEHVGRHRMPQHVAGALREPRLSHIAAQAARQSGFREGPIHVHQEQRRRQRYGNRECGRSQLGGGDQPGQCLYVRSRDYLHGRRRYGRRGYGCSHYPRSADTIFSQYR